ncbi:MAG: ParB/RepB/Spo0J family partition protein [Candidatus Marinimicrobia bacterium]|nr:ParB/RepB/Spo0J family partition protein [Candidatus Neomarinimicrobiota bacterium]
MTVKRLGKGISAIIPEYPQGMELVYKVAEVELDNICTNPNQPRKNFNEEAMAELKQSIREKGIIQPITIRQIDEGFELIAGERRLIASRELGLKTIPSYILPVESDAEMVELALIENLQREDLNPVEEAEAFQILSDTFNLSHEEIAKKVSKVRSTITNSLRLLNLPEPILRDLREAKLSAGHARPILSLDNEKQQINLWRRIKRDGLNVRDVESLVKKVESTKHKFPEKKKHIKTPFVKNLEERLMHIMGSRVRIRGNEKKGNIEIEFYSKEDLNRLLEIFESIEDLSN